MRPLGLAFSLFFLSILSQFDALGAEGCRAAVRFERGDEVDFEHPQVAITSKEGQHGVANFILLLSDFDPISVANGLCSYCGWGSAGTRMTAKRDIFFTDYSVVLNEFGEFEGLRDMWNDRPTRYSTVRKLSCLK